VWCKLCRIHKNGDNGQVIFSERSPDCSRAGETNQRLGTEGKKKWYPDEPSDKWPSCNAPIVGTSPMDFRSSKAFVLHARTAATSGRRGIGDGGSSEDILEALVIKFRLGSWYEVVSEGMTGTRHGIRALSWVSVIVQARL
jgi:hypothetical protein